MGKVAPYLTIAWETSPTKWSILQPRRTQESSNKRSIFDKNEKMLPLFVTRENSLLASTVGDNFDNNHKFRWLA